LRYSDDDGGGPVDDEPGEEAQVKEATGVTITGAHQAVSRSEDLDAPPDAALDDWSFVRGTSPDPELPHWTEAPTGQVPAVLSRDDADSVSDDPWSSLPSPTWRQNESDWTDQEQRFEPAMLGDEGGVAPVRDDDERRPWEFDEDDDATLVGMQVPEPRPATAAPATRVRSRATRSQRPEGSLAGRAARPGISSSSRDMRMAILTGSVLAALVIVVFDLTTIGSLVLAAAVVTLAAGEAFSGMRLAGHRPAAALGLVACLALMVATYNKGVTALPLVAALLFVFTFLWFLGGVEQADVVDGVATTMLVFLWVGVLGSFAALLLAPSLFPDRHGVHFLLGAVIVVVANDMSALVFGKLLGRHPMAPSISPNKTWEGAIGAAVVTVIAGACISALPNWSVSAGLTLGILAAFLAPLGDLCESMLKRSLGLKDLGHSLPGHGGFLDRVDGLLFVLPATYYVVLAFHLA
jgi:phosphatidate cytidylyltransferase